jgi:hypothetical protein
MPKPLAKLTFTFEGPARIIPAILASLDPPPLCISGPSTSMPEPSTAEMDLEWRR